MSEQRTTGLWWRLIVAIVIATVMGAVVVTGFNYVNQGLGGVVPFLMIAVAPLLAAYYVWYLLIRARS